MQLGEPESIRPLDDDRIRGRYIDTAFNDRGANEQVEAPMIEIEHELLEFAFTHLSVPDPDTCFGHEGTNVRGATLNRFDTVVHEIDLAAAADLTQAGFAHLGPVPFADESLDRESLGGRRGDQRQIAQAAQGHAFALPGDQRAGGES